MSEAAEKLKALLTSLSPAERAEIVDYLVLLAEEDDLGEFDDEYIDEINRRVADFEAGKTVGIPHEEVMRQMKEKYG